MKEEPEAQEPPIHLYEFGPFRLDTTEREDKTEKVEDRLLYNCRPLRLTGLEFSLLCVLVRNHGRDLNCDELIKAVWPKYYVGPDDNSKNAPKLRQANLWRLQQLVTHLRKKLGGDTIWNTEDKKGYTLGLPVKEIPPAPPHVYEDLKFNRWIRLPQKGRPITLALGAGVALTIIYLACYLLSNPGAEGFGSSLGARVLSQPIVVLSLIQAVVIGGAFAARPAIFDRGGKDFSPPGSILETSVMRACGYDDPGQWEAAKRGAKDALTDYAWAWKFLLAIWFILYLMIFLAACVELAEDLKALEEGSTLYYALGVVTTLFNNFNTLALALCYVALHYPTGVETREPAANKNRLIAFIISAVKKKRGLVMIIGLVLIVLFTAAECVRIFHPPADGTDKKLVMTVMDVASGLLGGTALALYVGRIGSKFLAPPVWLVPALYFYAVIQPFYLFIQNRTGGAFIIGAALILKSLLYLYMAWLFKSGRLLFYMVRVRAIYESVDAQWEDFLWNLDKA